MKRDRARVLWLAVVGLLGALVLISAAWVSESAPVPKALWAWEGPQSQVLDTAVEDGFTSIFLYAPPGFSDDPSYATFVADANESGIEVWALGGEPFWAREQAPFEDWAREATESELFVGLAPDVEPWALPGWESEQRQESLIDSYLIGLGAVASETHLPVNAAVPFWFDEIDHVDGDVSWTLIESVMDRVDMVSVLAYRDTASGEDGIVALVEDELAYAARAGIEVVVAVETAPITPEKVTFAEEGRAFLYEELSHVSEELRDDPSLAGLAVHDHENYSRLAE